MTLNTLKQDVRTLRVVSYKFLNIFALSPTKPRGHKNRGRCWIFDFNRFEKGYYFKPKVPK